MNKYVILFALNFPFVIYGYIKTYIYWEAKKAGRISLLARVIFWTMLLVGLVFAETIYNFFIQNNITNSPPLSLADVVLVTAFNFTLFIIIRLYGRIDTLEHKLTQMVSKQALHESNRKRN